MAGKYLARGVLGAGKIFFVGFSLFERASGEATFLSFACYYAQKCIETSVQPAGKHGQKVPMCGLQEKSLTAENATPS